MEILIALIIIFALIGGYYYESFKLKLPIENSQTALISTLATVYVSNNGKKEYHETGRVSVYSDSIVVMRLPRLSRYSHEVRDYSTGLASMRSNFRFIRNILNETKYRFAHRLTKEVINSISIDKNKGIATIIYQDDGNTTYTLRISKLIYLSPTHIQLIKHLARFRS